MNVEVGVSADFAEHRLRLVWAGRRQIGVVRWDGALYAVNNYCTHQGGPLCLGLLSGRLESDRPGAMSLDATRPVLACPWHGWEFDLRTGCALFDPATRVRLYPVSEVQGRVLIDLDGKVAEAARGQSDRPATIEETGAV